MASSEKKNPSNNNYIKISVKTTYMYRGARSGDGSTPRAAPPSGATGLRPPPTTAAAAAVDFFATPATVGLMAGAPFPITRAGSLVSASWAFPGSSAMGTGDGRRTPESEATEKTVRPGVMDRERFASGVGVENSAAAPAIGVPFGGGERCNPRSLATAGVPAADASSSMGGGMAAAAAAAFAGALAAGVAPKCASVRSSFEMDGISHWFFIDRPPTSGPVGEANTSRSCRAADVARDLETAGVVGVGGGTAAAAGPSPRAPSTGDGAAGAGAAAAERRGAPVTSAGNGAERVSGAGPVGVAVAVGEKEASGSRILEPSSVGRSEPRGEAVESISDTSTGSLKIFERAVSRAAAAGVGGGRGSVLEVGWRDWASAGPAAETETGSAAAAAAAGGNTSATTPAAEAAGTGTGASAGLVRGSETGAAGAAGAGAGARPSGDGGTGGLGEGETTATAPAAVPAAEGGRGRPTVLGVARRGRLGVSPSTVTAPSGDSAPEPEEFRQGLAVGAGMGESDRGSGAASAFREGDFSRAPVPPSTSPMTWENLPEATFLMGVEEPEPGAGAGAAGGGASVRSWLGCLASAGREATSGVFRPAREKEESREVASLVRKGLCWRKALAATGALTAPSGAEARGGSCCGICCDFFLR